MTPQQAFDDMVAEGDMVLDKLDECAIKFADKVYLHYGEDGIRMTFAEVKAESDRIAAGLVAMGLPPGQARERAHAQLAGEHARDVRDLARGRRVRAGELQLSRAAPVLPAQRHGALRAHHRHLVR